VDVWRRSCGTRDEAHAEARRRGGARAREVILIAARVGQRREVVGFCDLAQRAGVRIGMTVSDARALLGPAAVRIVDHAPERDAAALGALARWAVRFSPRVAMDPPDGLLLDVTGCDRVHGGEARLASQLIAAVERLGFSARGAIAPTFGCAWGVARFGEGGDGATDLRAGQWHGWTIVPEGGVRAALHDLPTAALRIDEDAIAGLAEVGVERVGELLALPRGALRSRFGPELSQRLVQALGEGIETIDAVRPAAPPQAERVFDGPTARWEAIAMVARDLVDDLCAQLGSRERGAMRLELTLERSDAEPVVLEIQLAGPSRDRRHLWSLLRPKLERANMGFGVERMELVARRSARIAHRQAQRWREDGAESQQRERQLAELVDALSSRLGADRVLRAQMVESHIPERAERMAPALRAGEVRGRKAQTPAVAPGDRPTMLLPRPESARVITVAPDGPVLSMQWGGREDLRIVTSVGPERIEGEWWRRAEPGRDYFKLQDEGGRWLWVFRQRSAHPAWFVHGIWV
jgi:protein ImuB